MTIEANKPAPCLLLPVVARTLLLPTAAIAEIIPYKKSDIEILPDVPAWFVGMLSWRGIQVPVTILEQMEPYSSWDGIIELQSKPQQFYITVINRIAKINSNIAVQKFRQYPFFSIVLQGAPKLIWVSNKDLNRDDKSAMTDSLFLMEAKVEEKVVLIPNLESTWAIIDTLPSRLQWLGKIVRKSGDRQ
jgi:chemotaxis signal transduction protein